MCRFAATLAWEAGTLVSFETSPAFAGVSPDLTGRFAAFKILLAREQDFRIAFLDSVWTIPPSRRGVQECGLLHRRSFSADGKPALFWIYKAQSQPSALRGGRLLGLFIDAIEQAGVLVWFNKVSVNGGPGAGNRIGDLLSAVMGDGRSLKANTVCDSEMPIHDPHHRSAPHAVPAAISATLTQPPGGKLLRRIESVPTFGRREICPLKD